MLEEGLPSIFARCDRLMRATRAGATAMGLRLVAPDAPSPAVTGVFVPDAVDGGKLQKYLRNTLGVEVAGGQDQFKGRVLRIAHLGYTGEFDTIVMLSALELALSRFGVPVEFGRGTGAAQAILAEALPAAAKS